MTDGFDQRRARNTARYRRMRTLFMRTGPLCALCMANGAVTPARELDHILPCGNNAARFWDPGNLQALCRECHETKTARENACDPVKGQSEWQKQMLNTDVLYPISND